MLYFIYGNDREKTRARFRVFRSEIMKKCGEEIFVNENDVSNSFFDEAVSSRGLFAEATLFIFDSVFDKKEEQGLFISHAKEMVSSSNYFLILERSFDKDSVATLKESGVINEEYVSKKIDPRPNFNIFSLGDVLGKRNKKDLWVLYQNALSSGFETEEICSTLFWAVKNIALMKNANGGNECGISPFIAQKARVFAKNYTQKEIENLSRSLVMAYHEAHRGCEPMNIALERLILAL